MPLQGRGQEFESPLVHEVNSRGSSVVEQKTENLCVVSSILTPGTSNLRFTSGRGAVGSARGLGP